ncbi:lactoylglutathione lyase [Alteromonadaceae bacterium Bs31]|nr:lactoylglutathione lyase [Alteromonadaceae bacterium Bs31]
MNIEHIALWSRDIEALKGFYCHYFDASANEKYTNQKKGFSSYFLSFGTGARLEIMQNANIPDNKNSVAEQYLGLIHFAISLGSEKKVDELTATLSADGFSVLDGPRTTGDGYYESLVLDPEGNRIELTV